MDSVYKKNPKDAGGWWFYDLLLIEQNLVLK